MRRTSGSAYDRRLSSSSNPSIFSLTGPLRDFADPFKHVIKEYLEGSSRLLVDHSVAHERELI